MPPNASAEVSIISLAIYVFFTFNSIGQVPVFLTLLAPYEHKVQKRIIVRELLIALGVLLIFTFFGAKILKFIGISEGAIGIAGGLILLLIALNLLFPKEPATKGLPLHEPLIVPLAIPGLAGPGTMAALMVFSSQYGPAVATYALLIAYVPSFILLFSSSYIKNYLGDKGVKAVENLGGMFLCLLGIQMFAGGIIKTIRESFY